MHTRTLFFTEWLCRWALERSFCYPLKRKERQNMRTCQADSKFEIQFVFFSCLILEFKAREKPQLRKCCSFISVVAAVALVLLTARTIGRNNQLKIFSNVPIVSSENETDSLGPYVYILFIDGGSESTKQWKTLNLHSFEIIWNRIQNYVVSTYNVWQYQSCKVSPRDAQIMFQTILKYGGSWIIHAKVFQLKVQTFE